MRDKIIELFNYRNLQTILHAGNIKNHEDFLEKLVDLQVSIYHLDALLESKWEIDPLEFEPHWEAIKNQITRFGVEHHATDDYIQNIRTYLRHEMMLREGINPTDLDLEEYYYYKSCDVQLLRRLLIECGQVDQISNQDFRLFDLITEIDDDVSDVVEDHQAINGNGVVFIMHRYGYEEGGRILSGIIKAAMSAQGSKVDSHPILTEMISSMKIYGTETIEKIEKLESHLADHKLELKENKTLRLVTRAVSMA